MSYPIRPVFSEPDRTCTRELPGVDRATGVCGTCSADVRGGEPHDEYCRRYELEDPSKAEQFFGVKPITYLSLRAASERAPQCSVATPPPQSGARS